MPILYGGGGGGLPPASQEEQEAGIVTNKACVPGYNALRKIGDGWALGTGGDDRGTYAIDLQQSRTDESQVASGNYSFLGGGINNIVSGEYDVLLGGEQNEASGGWSTMSGGYRNQATGDGAVVGGGKFNIASGAVSVIGGGYANYVSGQSSIVAGGHSNQAVGLYASIFGGYHNETSNQYATVAGGYYNTASGEYTAIIAGRTNKAIGNYSVVSGGYYNRAYGNYACIVAGNYNNAYGEYSGILNGLYAKTNNYGQHTQASGRFSTAGDAQVSSLVARIITTNATPLELYLNGSTERLSIASDTTWVFRILVVARRANGDNESAGYEFKGVIDNNAGTTALVGSVTKTVLAEDMPAWDCDVTADDTNDALIITATGEAGKTIRWVAKIELVEVTG